MRKLWMNKWEPTKERRQMNLTLMNSSYRVYCGSCYALAELTLSYRAASRRNQKQTGRGGNSNSETGKQWVSVWANGYMQQTFPQCEVFSPLVTIPLQTVVKARIGIFLRVWQKPKSGPIPYTHTHTHNSSGVDVHELRGCSSASAR